MTRLYARFIASSSRVNSPLSKRASLEATNLCPGSRDHLKEMEVITMLFWMNCNECGLTYEHSINTWIYCPRCGSNDFKICEYNDIQE